RTCSLSKVFELLNLRGGNHIHNAPLLRLHIAPVMRVLFIVLAFLATASCLCKIGGKDRSENEKWTNDNFMVQCQRTKKGWKAKVIGCVVDSHEIPVGGKLLLGKTAYLCEKSKEGVVLRYLWY
ncbi:unnamed protein product, partial [Cylicocyclus nassatus]